MLACAGRLKRIEIENFSVIRNLDLIVLAVSNRGSWLMFVGENGTGKTSILQAVQLALIAPCRVDYRMIMRASSSRASSLIIRLGRIFGRNCADYKI